MKIIDAHNHIGDRRGRKGQTAEEIIAKMDASAIDQAVVFSYVPYPNNDYISEAVKKYPDRLIGFAILDHTQEHPEKELERSVLELGLKGLKLDTPTHGFSIDDFAVICYCGDNNYVHPYKFVEAAKRYPNANFIMAHAGILFMTSHAIEVCAENSNCYIEISNINACVINDAKNKGVLSQVLFGTDTPFNYFDVMKSCVECALTDEKEKALIYHQNFERIMSQTQIR